ncbi:hypothetical protein NP493_565g02024 [Ridgeia piscesae]|uniref:Uncharacterized protein n=1 Tax=Ridgeia piscesae TaxID=27915 RepID=A0AAD9NRL9_RIDPI|nr:hypothetical protein NP493_565g02024 [Ridgeia piscesae]
MQRTVHLHVMGRDELYRFNDITLVTQMTSERHDKLYRLAVRWTGPISVSIYLNRTSSLNAYTKKLKELLAPRKNIAIHIVKESGEFFPVNFLRNIALDNAATKYVFLTDIDFEPMPQLDIRLQEYIDKGYIKEHTVRSRKYTLTVK